MARIFTGSRVATRHVTSHTSEFQESVWSPTPFLGMGRFQKALGFSVILPLVTGLAAIILFTLSNVAGAERLKANMLTG